jgi:peptide/nickel transport system substrate-binding protein
MRQAAFVAHRRIAFMMTLAAAALLAVTAVAGCGGSSGGGTAASPAAKADIFRAAYSSTVTTWDPSASFSTEVVYLANLYEPLIYANPPGSAEPFSPALSTSWEVSDDGLEWTFKLREGVTFHDGTPFTAEAVKYSIDRTKKLNLGAAYIWAPVKEVVVVDDYTVKFVLSYPTALDRIAAASSGSWIFSPATEGKDQKWWDEGNEAGTGPWVMESYKPNEELVFVRNTKWWGEWQDNQFQKIVIKIVAEAGTQRQMLEAAEVDYIGLVARDQVDAMAANSAIDIVRAQTWNNYLMFFNTQKPPLDDVKVRQALSYAVPYEDLITVGANGLGQPSKGPVPVGLWPNAAGDLSEYTYDIEKAKQLLAEAGYPDGGFKLTLTHASENPLEQRFAPLIKESFAKVGVEVSVQPLLWNQQWEKAKGPAAKRQDLFVLLWWPSYPDGYDNLYSMFTTEAEPAWNLGYWYNEDYDATLDEAHKLSATDVTQSQGLYTQVQTTLIDDAPAAYLFDAEGVTAKLKTIKLSDTAINPNYPQVVFWTAVTL